MKQSYPQDENTSEVYGHSRGRYDVTTEGDKSQADRAQGK